MAGFLHNRQTRVKVGLLASFVQKPGGNPVVGQTLSLLPALSRPQSNHVPGAGFHLFSCSARTRLDRLGTCPTGLASRTDARSKR
jgi:hypothetical protein